MGTWRRWYRARKEWGVPIQVAVEGDTFLFLPAPLPLPGSLMSSLCSPPPLSNREQGAGAALGRPFSMTVGSVLLRPPSAPVLVGCAQQLQLRKANAEAEGDWGIAGRPRGSQPRWGRQDRRTAVPWPHPLGWPEEADCTGSPPSSLWPCIPTQMAELPPRAQVVAS